MNKSKRSDKEKSDRRWFYSSVKDRATGDNGEKLDGHISYEHLGCIWHEKYG